MWCVGNTPTWQVVVHDKMGGEFDGEIVTMRMTQKNVLMTTQKNVACRKHTNVASCGA